MDAAANLLSVAMIYGGGVATGVVAAIVVGAWWLRIKP